jgi:hypothetical protein|tara:strand:- start:1450 stop:1656 length:207 start_codon:yes stop_codon:yes gene_type:complete
MEALYRRQTALIADRGMIMNIVSWILLAIAVCALVARFAMKLAMKSSQKKLGLDDLFVSLAAVSVRGL